MEVVDVLECVEQRLADRQHWARRARARSADGTEVAADSPNAVAWCVVGAVEACTASDQALFAATYNALRNALPDSFRGVQSVEAFNDKRPHTDVLKLVERARA